MSNERLVKNVFGKKNKNIYKNEKSAIYVPGVSPNYVT